ncbi:bacteriochlorophyll 4-vinyl reductase [Telmatospirillum siberiense]|uniref:Bacteriochlorophyll 4-vinyl reductase n=1 Tax=Telmatospirillum siberiense TaxID=382514 RepID=A0A2N3PTD9_9PROT|nr:bacteriochlorophyll 4-vinyl reductase [Telmatospirillum siberiense]PKU23670.1 bacteriochlorophyll 4-vinyl reductase [Telmatospirillum siberiense]
MRFVDRSVARVTPVAPASVGPNAVTQVIAALQEAGLQECTSLIFTDAGVGDWLVRRPVDMVDERGVAGLHHAVRTVLPPGQAIAVMADAGRRTANYLLAKRIPRPVQTLFKILPSALASRAMMGAIRRHAWTFAGSGHFDGRAGTPMVFEIIGNPLCSRDRSPTPVCTWHAAVFQRLFSVLVSSSTRVEETACEACGDACCRFELSLD